MKVYGIFDEVSQETYRLFIEYALKYSDAFMLINYKSKQNAAEKCKGIFLQLRPFRIKRRRTWKWPSNECMKDPWQKYDYFYELNMYRASEDALDILLEPGGLFQWHWPHYPMDLCFFKDGWCWFSITAHENFATLYASSKAQVKQLREMGIVFWRGCYRSR